MRELRTIFEGYTPKGKLKVLADPEEERVRFSLDSLIVFSLDLDQLDAIKNKLEEEIYYRKYGEER